MKRQLKVIQNNEGPSTRVAGMVAKPSTAVRCESLRFQALDLGWHAARSV
jgi:hypothetical protein